MSNPNKAALRAYVEANRQPGRLDTAARTLWAEDAAINVVHPFNDLVGPNAYVETVLAPLQSAFDHLFRADYMAFAGSYEDGDWITSTGYYTGQFARPWLGIKPTGTLAHLRVGEFHRMENGRAVESYIYLDLPELMGAAGQWPIPQSPGHHRGFVGHCPGPATMDGLHWGGADAAHSQSSYQMVTDMLNKLATPDEAWRPYWHDHMTWYGPGAFGALMGLEEFAGFKTTFEGRFSEWIGGSKPGSLTKHFTRFAEGDYVCSGGWPSLNTLQTSEFFGQEPTGERLFMRVCDWWRRDGDKLAENWIFVDVPHVLLQLGRDVMGEIAG